MKTIQAYKLKDSNWKYIQEKQELNNPLVLVFGNRLLLEKDEIINAIRKEFPYEHIVFGSTSGEIINNSVFDDSIVVTLIEFEKSTFEVRTQNILNHNRDAKNWENICIIVLPKKI